MFKRISSIALVIGAIASTSTVFAATQTVTFQVPGMTCSSCPITVKKALMKIDGVQQTKTNMDKREALVTFDDTKTNIVKMAAATANAGYPVTVKAAK
jgi:mercuric ion binding protein